MVRWTVIRLSHDGIVLSCWSRRFDCNTTILHQAMRLIVYVSLFVAWWFAAMGAFRSFLLFRLLDVFCSLTGRLCGWSAVVLSDRRYPTFRNFDSTISIDVIRMKSYMDNLFDPTCVPVRVTINKTLFSLTLNLQLHLKTNSQLPPWNTPAGNHGSRMQNDTLHVWSLLFFTWNISMRRPWKCTVFLGEQTSGKTSHKLTLDPLCWIRLPWFTAGLFHIGNRPLRMVPPFVTAHTFCASRDIRVSYGICLLIQ